MKFNGLRILAVVLITVFTSALVLAASITNSDLPKSSKWYVHFNLGLIQNTGLGSEFVLETRDKALDHIQHVLGTDISDEIEGVTIFGGELPVRGTSVVDSTMIIHGSISGDTQSAVLSFLEHKGARVSSSVENGLTLYSFYSDKETASFESDDKERQYISWGDGGTAYFSFAATQTLVTHSLDMMQTFIDADGYLGGFDSAGPGAPPVLLADRALVQAGSIAEGKMAGKWDSPILDNLATMAVVVIEKNTDLQISVQLLADSEDAAMSVHNVLEGLVALKALDEAESPLGGVLRNVRFVNEGSTLRIDVPVSADQIEALRGL